jgi:hypothetical protein
MCLLWRLIQLTVTQIARPSFVAVTFAVIREILAHTILAAVLETIVGFCNAYLCTYCVEIGVLPVHVCPLNPAEHSQRKAGSPI